jgi:hypothetical protein
MKRATMKRKSKFPYKSTTINELIFVDLKGPIEVPTFGGKRYVLLFVDDYSNYVHTYFLRTKDEALTQFKLHYTFVQTQHGYKVLGFRGLKQISSPNKKPSSLVQQFPKLQS